MMHIRLFLFLMLALARPAAQSQSALGEYVSVTLKGSIVLEYQVRAGKDKGSVSAAGIQQTEAAGVAFNIDETQPECIRLEIKNLQRLSGKSRANFDISNATKNKSELQFERVDNRFYEPGNALEFTMMYWQVASFRHDSRGEIVVRLHDTAYGSDYFLKIPYRFYSKIVDENLKSIAATEKKVPTSDNIAASTPSQLVETNTTTTAPEPNIRPDLDAEPTENQPNFFKKYGIWLGIAAILGVMAFLFFLENVRYDPRRKRRRRQHL